MLLHGSLDQSRFGPEIRGQVRVRARDRHKRTLDKVAKRSGGSSGRSVAIFDSGKLKELLWDWCGDQSGSSGGRDQSHGDTTTLSSDLGWDGVWDSKNGSPVSTTDWDNGELGLDHCTTNGSLEGIRKTWE